MNAFQNQTVENDEELAKIAPSLWKVCQELVRACVDVLKACKSITMSLHTQVHAYRHIFVEVGPTLVEIALSVNSVWRVFETM